MAFQIAGKDKVYLWSKQFDSKKSQYQRHKIHLKEILINVDNLWIKGEQVMGRECCFNVLWQKPCLGKRKHKGLCDCLSFSKNSTLVPGL